MLSRFNKALWFNFSIEKKLFIYDKGSIDIDTSSGIRGTIFGATGTVIII
jgi:hypothetical protein